MSAELWDLRPPLSKEGKQIAGVQSLDRAEEPLTSELVAEFSVRGLHVRPRDAVANFAIQRASRLIGHVPSLERVVLECVRQLLILEAPDEQHDLSHSEPRWPHLIFVSLPPPTPVGAIRLAEAIVHEAMHLNLSLSERSTQMIGEDQELFSPWRDGLRPASGVLHGLYVFASLLRFFEHLQHHQGFSSEQLEHLRCRRTAIFEECSQVSRGELWGLLTCAGRELARRIFRVVECSEPGSACAKVTAAQQAGAGQ
jgi:HEXXH motif-containing protein